MRAAALLSAFVCITPLAWGDDACERPGLELCIRFEPAPDTRFGCVDEPCPTPDRREVFRRIVSKSGAKTITWHALNKAFPFPPGDRAADSDRVGLVDGATLNGGAADGRWAMRLATQDMDDCVHTQCGGWERSMLQISKDDTAAGQGSEQWWAHSVYLPANFAMPPDRGPPHWETVLFLEFHRERAAFPGGNQPMIALELFRQPGSRPRTVFRVRAHGANGRPEGNSNVQYSYSVPGRRGIAGQCIHDDPANGVWYHFVHHIGFSAGKDGFHRIWLREGGNAAKKVLDQQNINVLFTANERSYLVIGSYHDRHEGASTPIIHDRIRRGTSYEAVKHPDFPATPPARLQLCAGATLP